MSSTVYFGGAHQTELRAEETLPAKLDLILDKLNVRDRVKDQIVAIKMHLGVDVVYSTVHPVLVRKVVQAVKDGGGTPFVCDLPHSVHTAAS
ncbi:MAG: 4Fe-4S ferredoxin, partial [Candidatus Zixiibacteriota bacterium]